MKITFTVEAEGEDALKALAPFLPTEAKLELASTQKAARAATAEWTDEDVTKFWPTISPDSQTILALIADKPDGFEMSEIEKETGWNGLAVAGRLSSPGAMMRYFPNHQRPFTWDWRTRTFRTDRKFAQAVHRLLKRK